MSTGRAVAQRVEKLRAVIESLTTRQAVGIVLDLSPDDHPAWTTPLPDGRCVLIGLGDEPACAALLDALQADAAAIIAAAEAGRPGPGGALVLSCRRVASEFVVDAVDGREFSELLAAAARGEGKSQAALVAILAHAIVHRERGYVLPVRWQVVGTSKVYLAATVGRSMMAPHWRGCWALLDDDRVARLTLDGTLVAELDLVGVEDETGADRLRREVHCSWTDEPASALSEATPGITRQAWAVAFSSARLPTHRRVGLLTSNAPSPRSWLWRRFVLAPEPGCKAYRIPRGERTTEQYRADLERQLSDSPDLLQRLAFGEAAVPMRGLPVAKGYTERECVAPRPLAPVYGVPFYLGWDCGLTPACIIAQARDGRVFVYAAPFTERGGTAELVEVVRPWFVANAPWALKDRSALIHCMDPNGWTPTQHSSAYSPAATLGSLLRGSLRPGPVKWEPRRDAIQQAVQPGRSRLWISPTEWTEELRICLGGGWHYATTGGGDVRGERPDKGHPHSDLGDALSYVLCELWPAEDRAARRARQGRAKVVGVEWAMRAWS